MCFLTRSFEDNINLNGPPQVALPYFMLICGMGYYYVINPITLSNFSVGHRSLIAALYKVYLMVITICIRSTQAHSAHGSENCRNIWGQEIYEITGIRNLVGELCPEKRLTPGRIRERNQVQAVILMYTAISTTVGVKREPLTACIAYCSAKSRGRDWTSIVSVQIQDLST